MLVHSWGLIGPTELLDLRHLPVNWNQPGYQDGGWQVAVVIDPSVMTQQAYLMPRIFAYKDNSPTISPEPVEASTITDQPVANVVYRPRSIQFPVNVPISSTVIDGGLLSPSSIIGELVPPIPVPYLITFSVTAPTTFTVETLIGSVPPYTDTIRSDGNELFWQAADTHRPGVYAASTHLTQGSHHLTFTEVPQQGTTFSVSRQDTEFQFIPFQQGIHAGRRLLLAEPIRDLSQVAISSAQNLSL